MLVTDLIAVVSLALIGTTIVSLLALIVQRTVLTRSQRMVLEAERRLRPLANALAEGELPELPRMNRRERQALGRLLSRYSEFLTGAAKQYIASFFEKEGLVDVEIRRLRSRRAWRRATAAHLLGDIGSSRALGSLLIALEDRDRDVRSAAAMSLGRLGAEEAIVPILDAEVLRQLPEAVAGFALLAIGPEAVPELITLLGHDNPAVRATALRVLGLMGSARDADHIAERLVDSSKEVRARAAIALGRVGAAHHTTRLLEALDDPVVSVRAASAAALGSIGDARAIPALVDMSSTDVYEAAQAAARSIALIDPDAAISNSEEGGPQLQAVADMIRIFGAIDA